MRLTAKLVLLLTGGILMLKLVHFFISVPKNFPTQFENLNVDVDAEKLEVKVKNTINQGKINVTVYYEALCPDSKNFIMQQLIPVYEMIPGMLRIQLVPYGKAETTESNGEINFSCQHGQAECDANKIHACVIQNTQEDSFLQVRYVACMIKDISRPYTVAQECADQMNVNYDNIVNCIESQHASLLMKAHGEKTHSLYPRISFVPTVEVNGKQLSRQQIMKNFLKELCEFFENRPDECPPILPR